MIKRHRLGITLTEVLIAAGILAGLIIGVMQLFAVTQKQAVSSEALLHSGTLAQLVIERIKSNISQNPRYLRDLMGANTTWTHQGLVVDPTKTQNPGGLTLSPFFQYLFTRDAADLCQPGNQVTLAPASGTGTSNTGIKANEITALFETFREYEVKVEIKNDDAPLGSVLAPGPDPEAIKRVTVTVSRPAYTSGGRTDPLAFTVVSRVSTPADSLSDKAFDDMSRRFDAPPLADQWKEFMDVTGVDNPYLDVTVLGDESKNVLADAFIILSIANHESLLVVGRPIPGTEVLPPPASGDKFIDPWIAELSAAGVAPLSSSRRELAVLRARKAGVIFDSFKSMRPPMEHLVTSVLGPRLSPPPLRDKVTQITAMINALLNQIAALEAAVNIATTDYNNAAAALSVVPSTDTSGVAGAQAVVDTAVNNLTTMQTQLTNLAATGITQVQAERETIVLISLLMQIFTDPDYKDVAARPGDYDTAFKATIDALATGLSEHMDLPDATPYERMAAAKMFYDATSARQLEQDAPDAAGLAKLIAAGNAQDLKMQEFARYVKGGEVHDFARLKARNARFAERVKALKTLCPLYRQVVTFLQPGGPADQMLKAYEQFGGKMNLDPKSILGALNKLMDALKKKK